jgi:hypothetical protein
MKRIYEPNYKGFLILPRATQFLLKNASLSVTEFGYFLLFLTQIDFDSRHKEIYTAILRDDKQLADMWGVNKTTVYKNKLKLLEKGLIQEDENGYFKINLLPLFLSKNSAKLAILNIQQLQNIFAIHKESSDEINQIIAKMQFDDTDSVDTISHFDPKSTFSSKEDLSLSNHSSENIDSDEILF